ncbi:hypothetical protein SKAU_G00290300 [Synaphobranchus kaupii]|uniref:Uncharacterized protein n=1 Tax=Synaphobranchus kaupii TaxID=118154 RepID=A0A9Q1ETM7_SYNKA|nr:hypothetical protein SKAU_G00290300 [Synaphobranchus kaupii]
MAARRVRRRWISVWLMRVRRRARTRRVAQRNRPLNLHTGRNLRAEIQSTLKFFFVSLLQLSPFQWFESVCSEQLAGPQRRCRSEQRGLK